MPEGHAKTSAFALAGKDMDAIVSEKTVISRWSDYRSAFETGFGAYRDAYMQVYEKTRKAAEEILAEIKAGPAYQSAPPAGRDTVVNKVFGPGKVCHYAPVSLSTVDALLEAAAKRSISSLDQALVALPGYRAEVEAELRALVLPPPPPGERVFEWRPVTALAGRRFKTETEVDQTLNSVASELKARIRDGYTVVVK